MSIAPTLETDRLILRAHTLDDFNDCASLWADPAVVRYISGKPSSREETWSRLLRYIGHWQALGFGYWVVQEKHTGLFLGEVGFADYKREITPSLEGQAEAGWVIAKVAHGRGIGEEAVRCMLDWADSHLAGREIVCIIDPAHQASIRLAHKVGFSFVVTTTYHGSQTRLLMRNTKT